MNLTECFCTGCAGSSFFQAYVKLWEQEGHIANVELDLDDEGLQHFRRGVLINSSVLRAAESGKLLPVVSIDGTFMQAKMRLSTASVRYIYEDDIKYPYCHVLCSYGVMVISL